jgi:hypothetical protein
MKELIYTNHSTVFPQPAIVQVSKQDYHADTLTHEVLLSTVDHSDSLTIDEKQESPRTRCQSPHVELSVQHKGFLVR